MVSDPEGTLVTVIDIWIPESKDPSKALAMKEQVRIECNHNKDDPDLIEDSPTMISSFPQRPNPVTIMQLMPATARRFGAQPVSRLRVHAIS